MTNAIPFDDWLKEQGKDVKVAMCDGHPDTLILVDMISLNVYRYVPETNQDGAAEELRELMRTRLGNLGIGVD